MENLEGKLLMTASPAAMRTDVLDAAESLAFFSIGIRENHLPGIRNVITPTGQVNYVAANGTLIESNGSCFDFVSEALVLAHAHTAYNPGPNNFYVWGTSVETVSRHDPNPRDPKASLPNSVLQAIQPGDVMQFANIQLSDGSFSATQHSAVVYSVSPSKGTVTVLEQNMNGHHYVDLQTINLSKMTEGTFTVYQPVSA